MWPIGYQLKIVGVKSQPGKRDKQVRFALSTIELAPAKMWINSLPAPAIPASVSGFGNELQLRSGATLSAASLFPTKF
jgi:hypothetical protein